MNFFWSTDHISSGYYNTLELTLCDCVCCLYSPGPNSPVDWMKQCVEALVPDPTSPHRRKILLGLNFYGNDYVPSGGGPIVGHQ